MLLKTKSLVFPLLKIPKNGCSVYLSTSAVNVREEKIKVGEHHINYVKVGNGPHNLLCMPGALGTIWTDFRPQVEGINRDKFTIVAWDPPGYGKSRPPEKKFSTDFYEKDADDAFGFMKALKIPKYSVLGWSDGGITGMIHAAKYPDVMKNLVIWGSNSFILPHELEMYKSKLKSHVDQSFIIHESETEIKDINSWSKKMRQPMIEAYGEELFAKYWANWVEAMINIFTVKDGNICSEFLKDIKCPTLILYGEKDPLVDRVHVSHLHTNISGSRIHLYPEGKHNVHINYAEDFNKRVQEFLLR